MGKGKKPLFAPAQEQNLVIIFIHLICFHSTKITCGLICSTLYSLMLTVLCFFQHIWPTFGSQRKQNANPERVMSLYCADVGGEVSGWMVGWLDAQSLCQIFTPPLICIKISQQKKKLK